MCFCGSICLELEAKQLHLGSWIIADVSCFQGLLFCPDAASLLLHNFCIYHIDAPGHEVGITIIPSTATLPFKSLML